MGEAARNGTKAAILAGYSAKTAAQAASRLLRNVQIRAAINTNVNTVVVRAEARQGVTVDRVVSELARIGFSDLRELVDETGRLKPLHELSEDAGRALAGVEVSRQRTKVSSTESEEVTVEEATVKVKLWDKVAALTTLCRHLGILRDKVDHTHRFSLEDVLDASRSDGAPA